MIHNCDKEEQRKIVGFTVGDFVMYTDIPNKIQVNWGGHDHPDKAGMKIGGIYQVADIEIHDSYTCTMFNSVVGRFNHLSFTLIDTAGELGIVEMRDHALQRAETAKYEFSLKFKEWADKWIAGIQKCGLTILVDCQDCLLNENCQNIRRQLVLMQRNLGAFIAGKQ